MATQQTLTAAVKVRITEKQSKQLDKLAKQHGMSRAEYMREVVFS
jgi:predicted DNA-binding protein